MNPEEIACIFCGKESNEIAWVENGFTGRRCDCGLLYISPRPDAEEVLDFYNAEAANRKARSRVGQDFAGRLNGRHRLKLLRKHISRGRLLEIGPGGGYFLHESRRAGFSPFGIELNRHQAVFIETKLGIPVEMKPLTESSFGGTSFDVICHFEVISHFYDPIYEFEMFHQRLRGGGILFFETGNGGDLSPGWLRFIGRLQYPDHLFLFSERNIEELCKRTGFRILSIHRYSTLLQLAGIKLFQKLKVGPAESSQGGKGGESSSNGGRQEARFKSMIWKILILGSHFVRYRIGRMLPNIGPQTVVYIAQKVP